MRCFCTRLTELPTRRDATQAPTRWNTLHERWDRLCVKPSAATGHRQPLSPTSGFVMHVHAWTELSRPPSKPLTPRCLPSCRVRWTSAQLFTSFQQLAGGWTLTWEQRKSQPSDAQWRHLFLASLPAGHRHRLPLLLPGLGLPGTLPPRLASLPTGRETAGMRCVANLLRQHIAP